MGDDERGALAYNGGRTQPPAESRGTAPSQGSRPSGSKLKAW